MREEFKDIEGYEGLYQVSNLGNVKSLKRKNRLQEKILKAGIGSHGYLAVTLTKCGIQKTNHIHHLVAIALLGHEPNGHKVVIDHIDNNPLNNNVDNLQLITQRENLSKNKVGGSSVYVGVTWDKSNKKWKSQIMINGKLKNLGRFTDELEAAESYIIELQKLYI
jgi:hypothetical protein